MSEFYVVEFPNEDNEKSRGPFVVSEGKVESTDHENEVQVRWEAIDAKGDIIDSYYAGVCLFKGARKACADFKDKLRKNRETVEISNKESRSRKKSAKLLESDDSELFVLNDSWNLSGPPKKKQKTSLKSQGKENNTELHVSEVEDDSPIEKPKPKKPKPASKAKGGKSTAKNVNVSKLRQQTQHKQSSDIGASLIREKMKIVRKHEDDSESAELEIMVEKDMSLESLKKKLSSATGIPLNKLCIIARGEIVSDCPPETQIKELWSVDDIVVIYPVMENDAPKNKSNTIINLEAEEQNHEMTSDRKSEDHENCSATESSVFSDEI